MLGKRKFPKVEEKDICFCGGALPREEAKSADESAVKSARILVLGAGCPKCRALEQTLVQALEELHRSEAVGHVTDYAEMAKYGVMSTPALVIDGKVVSAGRVLNRSEVVKLLNENL